MSRSSSSSAEPIAAETNHRSIEALQLSLLKGLEGLHVKAKGPKLVLVAMFMEAAIEELRDGLALYANGSANGTKPPALELSLAVGQRERGRLCALDPCD